MPLPLDYKIPIQTPIQYPSICPICQETALGEKNKVHLEPDNKFKILKWLFKKTETLILPIHQNCVRQLRRHIAWQRVYSVILFLGVLSFLKRNLRGWELPDSYNSAIVIGYATIGIFIFWILPIIYPVPISIRKKKKYILFEIKSKVYAHQFAELNDL